MYVILDPQVVKNAFCNCDKTCMTFVWSVAEFCHFTICVDQEILTQYETALLTCDTDPQRAISYFKEWLRSLRQGQLYGSDKKSDVFVVVEVCQASMLSASSLIWDVGFALSVLLGVVAHPEISDWIVSKELSVLEAMDQVFSLEDLSEICMRLQVDYENLGDKGKRGKMLELIRLCKRLDHFDRLREVCRSMRPTKLW